MQFGVEMTITKALAKPARNRHAADLWALSALVGARDWFISGAMNESDGRHDSKSREEKSREEVFVDLLTAISERRDRAAFERLFDFFAPRVRSYMLRLGAEPTAADDLVQDVMLTVWRRAVLFDPSKAGVSTWIFTIARNRRIDLIRRERRPEIDPNDPALVKEEEPASDAIIQREQSASIIRAAIAELPKAQSELLDLAYFQDMSHGEIAGALSLPLGTVKSRIRLAMDKLRVKLLELK